jgi:hypothetical protein
MSLLGAQTCDLSLSELKNQRTEAAFEFDVLALETIISQIICKHGAGWLHADSIRHRLKSYVGHTRMSVEELVKNEGE